MMSLGKKTHVKAKKVVFLSTLLCKAIINSGFRIDKWIDKWVDNRVDKILCSPNRALYLFFAFFAAAAARAGEIAGFVINSRLFVYPFVYPFVYTQAIDSIGFAGKGRQKDKFLPVYIGALFQAKKTVILWTN